MLGELLNHAAVVRNKCVRARIASTPPPTFGIRIDVTHSERVPARKIAAKALTTAIDNPLELHTIPTTTGVLSTFTHSFLTHYRTMAWKRIGAAYPPLSSTYANRETLCGTFHAHSLARELAITYQEIFEQFRKRAESGQSDQDLDQIIESISKLRCTGKKARKPVFSTQHAMIEVGPLENGAQFDVRGLGSGVELPAEYGCIHCMWLAVYKWIKSMHEAERNGTHCRPCPEVSGRCATKLLPFALLDSLRGMPTYSDAGRGFFKGTLFRAKICRELVYTLPGKDRQGRTNWGANGIKM